MLQLSEESRTNVLKILALWLMKERDVLYPRAEAYLAGQGSSRHSKHRLVQVVRVAVATESPPQLCSHILPLPYLCNNLHHLL
jgi:hypothetical protein